MRLLLLHIIFLLSCISSFSQGYEISKLDLNTRASEYGPFVLGNQFYFCSNKKVKTIEAYKDANGDFPSKIFNASIGAEMEINKSNQALPSPISTHNNEGPLVITADGQTIYYTGTIPSNNRNKVGNTGIFISHKTEKGWSSPEDFPFNTTEHSFDTGHPTLSPDGKTLYFSSNQPGGLGGTDLYKSEWTGAAWGQPENLGPRINSDKNEILPYLFQGKTLYFSSNKDGGAGGYDLYMTSVEKENSAVISLEAPINSEANDFSICFFPDGENGFFASNRDGNDDIYKMHLNFPEFASCEENYKIELCYFIEETKIEQVDSLPFVYEWDYGDGTTARGLANEHCFPGPGDYEIYLNINDTVTKTIYGQVSHYSLPIAHTNLPYIESADSLGINEWHTFKASKEEFIDFTPSTFFWIFGDGQRTRGDSADFRFAQEGYYPIILGAIDITGESPRLGCVTKTIKVGNPPEPIEESVATLGDEENAEASGEIDQTDHNISNEETENVYFVEVAQSDKQLSIHDPYFEKVTYEITERFTEEDSTYRYTVGESDQALQLYTIYKELVQLGYNQSVVKESILEDFKEETTQKGWNLPDSIRLAINNQLKKFSDIQFAYDKATIEPESFENLDYIISVLQNQPELGLAVTAHTDSLGTAEHNMKLSKERARSVVGYFVSKGIAQDRLFASGKGESQPIASNETEEGRALNRRVQFEIVLREDQSKK